MGGDVTISFLIQNMDSKPIDYIVTMRIVHYYFGRLTQPTILINVELDAYETETLSRTITPKAEGSYDVSVDGMRGNFTVKLLPKPAEFNVSDLAVSTGEVVEGEPVTVTVNITNTGEQKGNHTVRELTG